MNTELLERFGWYIAERQLVWRRRDAGYERPWTEDPIIAHNHFTNVYRELDPGTMYAQEQMAPMSRQDRIWFAVAYRLLNRRSTFEEYGYAFSSEHVDHWLAYIDDRYERKVPTKTNRHLTPRRQWYEDAVRAARTTEVPRNARAAWNAISSVPGVGVFCGWQVFCDLVQVGVIEDDQSFVVVGDGAAYSIYTMYGQRAFGDYWHDGRAGTNIGRKRAVGGRVRAYGVNHSKTVWFTKVILWLVTNQSSYLREDFVPWNDKPLDNKNVEHSLCEWLRYERLKLKATLKEKE